jgi:RNA polymerase sigma-70 factor (ECF subfamily)
MSSLTATIALEAAQSSRQLEADARARRRAEDLLLVDGILRGEEEAFRRLVEKYQRPLYWVAYDVLHDAEEARDAVQEAFIRVHGAIGRFDRRRDLLNWMYRIARNLAIDAYRRRRRRAVSVEDVEQAVAADGGSLAAHADGDVADLDLNSQVTAVLQDLPVEYRMALTLREFHGLAPREIARVTDCSYPTARWRLHRARALFKKAWEARFGVQGEATPTATAGAVDPGDSHG